jgi:hypothetical protein
VPLLIAKTPVRRVIPLRGALVLNRFAGHRVADAVIENRSLCIIVGIVLEDNRQSFDIGHSARGHGDGLLLTGQHGSDEEGLAGGKGGIDRPDHIANRAALHEIELSVDLTKAGCLRGPARNVVIARTISWDARAPCGEWTNATGSPGRSITPGAAT